MNQEITVTPQVFEELFKSLYLSASQTDTKTSDDPVKDGIKVEVDWETSTITSIELDSGFQEFFLYHRETVTRMVLVYKMWERYVPHRPPTEAELAELQWPTEWVNNHYEFLEQFA